MHAGRLRSINVGGVPRVLLSSIDALARGHVSAADDPETAKWIQARAARRALAGRKGAEARKRNQGKGVAA
jgi:hypothetical protein